MKKYQYHLVRSSRKSIALKITPDGELFVYAPKRVSVGRIEEFIAQKQEWLDKYLAQAQQRCQAAHEAGPLTPEDIRRLGQQALEVIPKRVAYYAPIVGVTYGRITIRNQRTRWGSCSSLGNLNFNCLLMLAPPEVLDYVVVHELCHRKEMNHSPRFWAEVERVLPDYRAAVQWQKEQGGILLQRMEAGLSS